MTHVARSDRRRFRTFELRGDFFLRFEIAAGDLLPFEWSFLAFMLLGCAAALYQSGGSAPGRFIAAGCALMLILILPRAIRHSKRPHRTLYALTIERPSVRSVITMDRFAAWMPPNVFEVDFDIADVQGVSFNDESDTVTVATARRGPLRLQLPSHYDANFVAFLIARHAFPRDESKWPEVSDGTCRRAAGMTREELLRRLAGGTGYRDVP